MSHGRASNDFFRIATQQITPVGISKRVKCTGPCDRTQSLGQFPVGSTVCITCKPQGKNFRRGDL